jgi:anti-sigma28 factor (negative regulator of flagellin synthesis)
MSNLTEQKKPEIIALLIQGKTLGEVHKATGVSKSQIWRIKEQIKEGKYQASLIEVQENIGDLIAESLLLHLKGMNNIARMACEERYIGQQDAKSVAELHRTLESWSVSILSASSNLQQTRQLEELQSQDNQFRYLEIDSSDK